MILTVRTTLSCAHKLLTCVAEDSKCRRLHGHTYYVKVVIGALQKDMANTIGGFNGGVIVDADRVKKAIDDAFDHYYLNDRFEELKIEGETTLENLSLAIQGVVEDVVANGNPDWKPVGVTVREGDGAEVTLEGM